MNSKKLNKKFVARKKLWLQKNLKCMDGTPEIN